MSAFALDRALDKLREAGYKITNARRVVLGVLCDSPAHLTSAEVIRRVDDRDSTIGRASVFRTLELLTSLGIIRPTYLESRTPSYVVIPSDGHHAHLICTRCNTITEMDECAVDGLLVEIGQQHGLTLTGHLLELYGVCADCTALD